MKARVGKGWIIFGVGMFLCGRAGWAVQHVTPGAYPNAHPDQMHRLSAAQIRAVGSVKAALASGSTGTKNVAVILVQFPVGNSSLISGSNLIQSVATVKGYFDSMAAYYQEISYGKITLHFSYFNHNNSTPNGDAAPSPAQAGVYTLSLPEESYGCGDEGVGCVGVTPPSGGSAQNANGNYMIRDALIAARADHSGLNSSNFDGVILVHAGNGNETTPCFGASKTNGDIWSIFYSDDPSLPVISAAGGGFSEGDVVPEVEASCNGISSPLGVMCHEFGHSLGLPDLYNTSAIGGSSVVGKWELMDSGPYDGAGANPSHMGAWDKATLGWVTPVTGGTRLNTTLSYVEMNPSMLKIPVQNGLPEEYFLVEYRSRSSGAQYDKNIPGDGLLVWHIDDAITSARGINAVPPNPQNSVNIGTPHYGVSIVSADGTNPANNGYSPGNAAFGNTDVFTSPKSDNFSGQPSGISLVNISGIGGATSSLQVANLAVTSGQSISKVINFPNPAGKGYAHPNGAGNTTLQMIVTRPANDYQLNLYTLSGDLVRKVAKDNITLNVDRSDNAKWVYEYVWDLKNGDGQTVAPGVYLYLFRADGQSKSGKAVVIR